MELEREVFLSPLHIAEREGTTGIASVCAIFVSVCQTLLVRRVSVFLELKFPGGQTECNELQGSLDCLSCKR
jgi:hypothetical protein